MEKVEFSKNPVDLIGKDAIWVRESKELNESSFMNNAGFGKKIKQYLIMIKWLLSNHSHFKNSYIELSSLEHSFYLLSQIYYDHKLMSAWNELACHGDINEQYIYYALPYQPEQTTDPNAHDLSDAYLSLSMLSIGVGDKFKIVVKEHPAQAGRLHPNIRSKHYRTTEWYKKIAELPNVILAPLHVASKQLIDGCVLTAVLTGGTAWEGLLTGKPGLVFGDNWHAGCNSSPIVGSSNDIKQQISKLQCKSKLDVRNDVADFVNTISNNLVESEISDEGVLCSSLSRDQLVDNMTDALIRRF